MRISFYFVLYQVKQVNIVPGREQESLGFFGILLPDHGRRDSDGHHFPGELPAFSQIIFPSKIFMKNPSTKLINAFQQTIAQKQRHTLPLETYCEIFAFLSIEMVLQLNSTCLMFFRVSQTLYRPLQQPVKARVLENLHIFATKANLLFVSAKFAIRRLQNTETDKQ